MAYTFPQNGILTSFTQADTTAVTGFTNFAYGDSSIQVISNQLTGAAGSTGGGEWATSYGPNMEGYCTIVTRGLTGENIYLHIRDSTSGSNWNGYYLRVAAFDGTLIFRRSDSGSVTDIGNVAQTFANGDSVGFSAIGSSLKAYYKSGAGSWTNVLTVTDATYTGTGYTGIEIINATFRIDDFGGGTITSSLVPYRQQPTIYRL